MDLRVKRGTDLRVKAADTHASGCACEAQSERWRVGGKCNVSHADYAPVFYTFYTRIAGTFPIVIYTYLSYAYTSIRQHTPSCVIRFSSLYSYLNSYILVISDVDNYNTIVESPGMYWGHKIRHNNLARQNNLASLRRSVGPCQ